MLSGAVVPRSGERTILVQADETAQFSTMAPQASGAHDRAVEILCILGQGGSRQPGGLGHLFDRVVEVRPGSAADNAGLTAGEVILEVDRRPVTDADNFVSQVHAVPQNKDILLLVWSNGGASYRVVHPEESPASGM